MTIDVGDLVEVIMPSYCCDQDSGLIITANIGDKGIVKIIRDYDSRPAMNHIVLEMLDVDYPKEWKDNSFFIGLNRVKKVASPHD